MPKFQHFTASLEKAVMRYELQERKDLQEKAEQFKQTDERFVKASLKIVRGIEHTYVILMARSRRGSNTIRQIRCTGGNPFGGYVFDNVHDCYLVKCCDTLNLGYVPVSFKVTAGSWSVPVPTPEKVLRRYMDQQQIRALKGFQKNYNKEDYEIELIQLVE